MFLLSKSTTTHTDCTKRCLVVTLLPANSSPASVGTKVSENLCAKFIYTNTYLLLISSQSSLGINEVISQPVLTRLTSKC